MSNDLTAEDRIGTLLGSAAFPINVSGLVAYGLSKRELFAAMALNALVSEPSTRGEPVEFAKHAVSLADALLAELSRPT